MHAQTVKKLLGHDKNILQLLCYSFMKLIALGQNILGL